MRDCYSIVKSTLYQPHLTKVIFILHSQGGIEGGLIIDWLLQEVPQDLLAKLEVYTFGNAANHFNNPHLHLLSQHAALMHPTVPATTKTTTSVHYHDPIHPLPNIHAMPLPHREGVSNGTNTNTTSTGTTLNTTPPKPITRQISRQESTSGKTIRYIEHYAHTSDFVACWGVLHFTKNFSLGPSAPRFMGRVFERSGQGHQMNMHYLDGMFPLRAVEDGGSSESATNSNDTTGAAGSGAVSSRKSIFSHLGSRLGLRSVSASASSGGREGQEQRVGKGGIGGSGFVGADEREGKNGFMESVLELGLPSSSSPSSSTSNDEDAAERASEREGFKISYLGAHGEPLEDGEKEVLVRDMSPISPATMKRFERERLGMTSAQRLGMVGGAGKEKGMVNGDGKVRGEREENREEKMRFRVKDLSRLWLYVNGKSPKIDETDVGIARMATI